MVPMPLEPPWTRTLSPRRRPASRKTLDQQLAGRDGDPLRVAAAGEEGAHLVTDRPARHAVPNLADDAAAFEAQDLAGPGRGRVEALALQEVRAVHRRRGDVQDDLAGAADGVGDLAPAEHFGATGLTHRHRAHGPTLGTSDTPPRVGRP
jgi:hypothetical protein